MKKISEISKENLKLIEQIKTYREQVAELESLIYLRVKKLNNNNETMKLRMKKLQHESKRTSEKG